MKQLDMTGAEIKDLAEFADVEVNENGSINFHTYRYNSGAHWLELVEQGMKNE